MKVKAPLRGLFRDPQRAVFRTARAAALPALAAALAGASPAASQARPEWRVEASDAGGVVLLWENAARGREGESAPRSAALGLPAGSRPTAAVEILDGPGSPPRGAVADAAAAAAGLSLSKPARYRDLEVSYLAWDPAAGGRTAAAARIRVRYGNGTATGPAAGSKAPATAGASTAARPVFAPEAGSPAERHLRSWLVNYPQTRAFRSQPAAAAKAGTGAAPGASLPAVRLIVRTRGENIAVVDYDALRKAGAPVDRIDPRRMRLFRDGLEVPIHVSGGDDGRWHPGDYIEFVGRAPAGESTRLSLYSSTAAFILTWDGGRLGLRAPAVPVAPRGQGPLSPPPPGVEEAPPFRAVARFEEDLEVLRIGGTSEAGVVDLGVQVRENRLADFWMWTRQNVDSDTKEIPFELELDPVGFGDVGAPRTAPLRVRVNLKGITDNPKADPDHHVKFLLNGRDISLVDGVANDAIWDGQDSLTWTSRDLDPSVLRQGRNTLVLQKVNDLRTNDGALVEMQDAYLNWFELEFPSGYRVRNDRILFSNDFADSLGTRTFHLEGFTTRELSVWDLGGRKLTGFGVNRRDTAYAVSLTDSLAGPARYLACALDRREVPGLLLDTLPDLVSPAEGADWLVITHKELLGTALDSLVGHRERQGLRARVVQAGHIYQAFGDGSLDPAAIRRFVAHAYRHWPRPAPAYLLLVGDGSLWFEKKSGSLQRTLVPTGLVDIEGWGVAANDDYFAQVSGDDAIPDLMVGRIPAASRGDLSKVVRKILALETARPAGHHDNKALLISGFEEPFALQNSRLQALLASRDRQYSRLDLFPGSPYYRSAPERGGLFDQLDSAFTLVSFVGHGGGAVWSDAGVLTLRHLDEGRLRGEYPIPFVSSITCLTGYFEDWSERSLGEEMLRLDRGGAAAFYGAAGYISNLAGEALSHEVLAAAAGGATTAGAVVRRAETMVQLKTGGAYAPILSEFNLLGDPALRLDFPESSGGLAAEPRTLNGKSSLELRASGLAPADAEGVLTLFLGDSVLSSAPVRVAGGSLVSRLELAGPAGPVPDGKAVLHFWSGKEGKVATAPFTALDWLIDSVRLEPPAPAPGDSARVVLRLSTAYARTAVTGGIVSWAVGGDQAPLFPGNQQAALLSSGGDRIETASRFVIPQAPATLAAPRLHLAFRLAVQVLDADGNPAGAIANLSSRVYALPLTLPARLSFADPAFRVPVQDSLGAWVAFRNAGLGPAADFAVVLTRDAEGPSPAEDTAVYRGTLAFGAVDSLFFPLPDSLLDGRRLRASLLPARAGDLADRATVRDTVFRLHTRLLSGPADTLFLGDSARLTLAPAGAARRVFAERVGVTALPGHLLPPSGSLPAEAWRLHFPASAGDGVILADLGASALPRTAAAKATAGASPPAASAPAASAAGAADGETPAAALSGPLPTWHWRDPDAGSAWIRLDTAAAGPPGAAMAWRSGWYGLFRNLDATPPLIQFSSRGQALLQDDYVPRNTPIDVVIRDAEGVDLAMRPPDLRSERQALDSSTSARETGPASPTLARFNFLPKHSSGEDVLEVIATDVSGNVSRKTLAYRQGEDLSIRNLGSYPNPFADTAVFVYSLTDYCERVQLRIYSRAGRLVRSLEERNVVGYREVLWDGRAEGGGAIGNGLYFLKVTAHAGDRESSKVFKLFKKRRK